MLKVALPRGVQIIEFAHDIVLNVLDESCEDVEVLIARTIKVDAGVEVTIGSTENRYDSSE